MITYRLDYPKKCREDLKALDKFYSKNLPKNYTGTVGKSLCFKFDSEESRKQFIEMIHKSLHDFTDSNYEIYKTYAIIKK